MFPQKTENKVANEIEPSELVPLWTVGDVARYLRLNPETVRVMVRKGDLPGQKIGRQWRFYSPEIQEFAKKKK